MEQYVFLETLQSTYQADPCLKRLIITDARVWFQANRCWICGRKSATPICFSSVFRFYPFTVIPHLINIQWSYITLAVDSVYGSLEALQPCTTQHVSLWQKATIRIFNLPEKLRVVRFHCVVSLSLRHRARKEIQVHFLWCSALHSCFAFRCWA
jgi:hypothetical protein